jgi:RNA polymerase sigma-70 factor (ECF subfamily)
MHGDDDARLASISTQWTKLFQAHQDEGPAANQVYREQLLRYYGAVYRYLLGTLRDLVTAEELTQEFAVRFLRGDFRRADHERGRFRDFLKTALRHLAIDHWRKQEHAPARLGEAEQALAASPVGADLDQAFLQGWRKELLRRAWQALARFQQTRGSPYFTVLKYKTENPQARATQLAEHLGDLQGKALTEAAVRQLLHRAREHFADLLLEEVAQSVPTTDWDIVEQELIALDLLDYCRSALQRKQP